MNAPTIIFDLDGTLADTIQDLVGAMNRAIAEYDLPPMDPREMAPLTGKGGLRAMIRLAFEQSGTDYSSKDIKAAFAATVQDYDTHIAVDTVLFPNVRETLDTFRSQGWRQAVCTNKPIAQTTKLLRALDIAHYFDAVLGADSGPAKKPDPAHILETIRHAGGVRERAVMVGDTITDIKAAKNAAIPVIAVDFGYSDVLVADLDPDAVISSYDTLYDRAVAVLG